MGNEIDSHKPLLNLMEKDVFKFITQMDKVDNKLKKTENKLKNYLEKTSDGVLWKVILVEFVILLIFILI